MGPETVSGECARVLYGPTRGTCPYSGLIPTDEDLKFDFRSCVGSTAPLEARLWAISGQSVTAVGDP